MSDRGQPGLPDISFASMAAHQMQSPVAAASGLLKSLLTGAAGPLSPEQKHVIHKAIDRCEQALESVRRMLAIAHSGAAGPPADTITDLATLARRVHQRYTEEALQRAITFALSVDVEPARVAGLESALSEAVDALVNNAFKYTPDGGTVLVSVMQDPADGRTVVVVADSGVGIADQERDRVFEPFYRTPRVQQTARPGTGLGLTFVRAVVEAAGGTVAVGRCDLGGAEFRLRLPPLAPRPVAQTAGAFQEGRQMKTPLKVVIVGGVAAGPKAAAKIIRLMPDAEVTIVEKGKFLSYAGCGLPYYISGVVRNQKDLMSTPLGSVRDPVFFQQVKNVDVMSQTEALAIDRKNKTVRVRDSVSGAETWLEYDKLVLATGAEPIIPNIPGTGLANVFTLHGVHDAEGIKNALARGKARDVTIVGGGLLGVEITEALAAAGCRVTIVERLPQILRILDWEMAALVEQHLETHGVKVLTGTSVERLSSTLTAQTEGEGETAVRGVVTNSGLIPTDTVILAIGVRPNVHLADKAGLELGTTGAIKVDERMCTSDPDIFAAGDCVECVDLLTGKACYVPLGSTANKQGRVAAMNICERRDVFPGVLGSTVCKVFDYCVARTGLTETFARGLGYDVTTVLSPAPDRAHYMPNARPILLKLVVDTNTRKLLGAQAVGPGACDKRMDVVAMALAGGMTVDALANADLCYAPPYAEAMDNLITAANVARNKLDGLMVGVTPMEVRRMMDEGSDFVLLDVRRPAEHERGHLPGSTSIPLGSLRGRMDELPRDKPIVTFCTISLRGYEAALLLRAAGFKDVRVMDGGIEMWPYEKVS
ncbi:MAG: FAD-dependent oxidoreductase [Planctomycetes bacterium]|nr:FAD-dependent oxidoreductase [Planctomycetota bacterium]